MRDDPPENDKQRLYRLAFESARDATVIFGADGRVLLLNRAARELPQELVERLVDDDGPRAAELARFRDELRQGGRAHAEVAADGKIFGLDGRTHGDQHIVSLRDVTERRRVDAELRALQRAESIGHLTASVVHDFNNLLTPISCLSAQLEGEAAATPQSRDTARDIRIAAERATSLARQMLWFARRHPAQIQRVNVGAAVLELQPLLERIAGVGVELELSVDPGAGEAFVDRERLEHVLLNLAASARDASPPGGRLVIRTGAVSPGDGTTPRPEGASEGSYVVLTVTDSGPGLPPGAREKVFEKFLSTKDDGGHGIGLASARRFAAESRGCITVHSEPSLGTTLAIYLPRVECEHVTPSSSMAAAEPRVSGAETVLVVDDVEGVRNAMRAVLEDRGYRVLIAASGEEALEISQSFEGPIHLTVIDLVMPRMPGTELARRIQFLRPTRILLTSGHTDRVIERHGVRIDHALLRKAFSPAELLRKVRQILDGDDASEKRSCG